MYFKRCQYALSWPLANRSLHLLVGPDTSCCYMFFRFISVADTWSTDPKPVLGSSKWTTFPNMAWTIQVLVPTNKFDEKDKKEQSVSFHLNADHFSFQMRKTKLTTRKSRKLCSWKSEPPRLTRYKGFFLPCRYGKTICYEYSTSDTRLRNVFKDLKMQFCGTGMFIPDPKFSIPNSDPG
jgi:hypothetical protein